MIVLKATNVVTQRPTQTPKQSVGSMFPYNILTQKVHKLGLDFVHDVRFVCFQYFLLVYVFCPNRGRKSPTSYKLIARVVSTSQIWSDRITYDYSIETDERRINPRPLQITKYLVRSAILAPLCLWFASALGLLCSSLPTLDITTRFPALTKLGTLQTT